MTRSSYRYGLSRRARRLPELAAPLPYLDTLTAAGKQLVAARATLKRAALAEPAEIRRHMALDLAEVAAIAGGVTDDDLSRLGWTAAQIAANKRHAVARAHDIELREAAA